MARKQGFTLVEMLLVVSLILVMVAMLVPAMQMAIRQANNTVCMHNLKEIGQALHLYRIENDGWLPNVDWEDESEEKFSTWFVKLFPRQLSEYGIMACPEDPFHYRWQQVDEPRESREAANFSSYGLNNFIMRAGGGYLANLDRRSPSHPLNTLLLADIGPDRHFAPVRQDDMDSYMPPRNASLLQWDDQYDSQVQDDGYPWVTTRHGRGINVLTVGGSVQAARTIDLIRNPIRSYYPLCDAGGCSICRELKEEGVPHYTFAKDQLYWYTGPLPPPTSDEFRRY